ncbi:hypothetical protein MTBUT4_120069 [Magnetospirillum sp. UT-4]|nr:hypothetical protein MTBUT4_120069 [Magnetospirillum sp. UT-4]
MHKIRLRSPMGALSYGHVALHNDASTGAVG